MKYCSKCEAEIHDEAVVCTKCGCAVAVTGEAYCDMVKHVLLLLFTCGIYHLIWVYRMTKYTNYVSGEEYRDPTRKLLLCLFVPFYLIYWTYKTAQRIDKIATDKGIQSNIAVACLILSFFIGIVSPILMQDKMNRVATTLEQSVEVSAASDGVVTQETFGATKKTAEYDSDKVTGIALLGLAALLMILWVILKIAPYIYNFFIRYILFFWNPLY